MPIGDILPEMALVATAVAALLAAMFTEQGRSWMVAPLTLLGLAVAAFLCTRQLGRSELTFSGDWALDGLGVWSRLMIIAVAAFAVLLAPAWLRSDRRHGEYYAMLVFAALGSMAMAGAADLLQLVVAVLLSSAAGYTLAAYHRDWALSVEAGMKYFLVGAFANALLTIGVALIVGLAGHTGYREIAAAGLQGSPLLLLGMALAVSGIAFKLAAVPAHAWLPDVAQGAPVPSAAFLTVAPKIGAAVALVRFTAAFPENGEALGLLISVLAVATMTLGNLAALWQRDVRRLIGWSSVSQSGYALMAICIAGQEPKALPALHFFLVGYAAANLAAFAAVAHLRGRTALEDYGGLVWCRPLPAIVLIVSFLSLVGIPPLAGFVGKLMLFAATVEAGYSWLAVVAVLNTVASLFYYLRVIGPMHLDPPRPAVAVLDRWTAVSTGIGAASVLGLGLMAEHVLAAFAGMAPLP